MNKPLLFSYEQQARQFILCINILNIYLWILNYFTTREDKDKHYIIATLTNCYLIF